MYKPGGVVTCLPHQFQCGSQECLDPSLVCNGITNCADGSDEGGSCRINCAEADSRRCSQNCYNTPQGTVSILQLRLCVLEVNKLEQMCVLQIDVKMCMLSIMTI